ncbi:MAG: ATP-dependent helicase [Proteobacteria bacterium]|nr:ATP-dependent helicase [Pseudomonadota bacterium]MBU1688900.1 ATP-dependent helicase [Pseudomonadota bacterium]
MQRSLFPSADSDGRAISSLGTALEGLNDAQREAATCLGSPVLVIAGAGTGKTRTLVHRMAYLVDQGISAENILLLTFTRKAAQEMIDRAGRLIDHSAQRITGGTFHAVANILLRRFGHHLGYASNFTILDRSDSEGILNLIKSSLNLGSSGKRFPTRRVICNLLSRAVNKSRSLEETVEDQYAHLAEFLDDLVKIQKHYHQFKLEHGLMDYDDLLVNLQKVLSQVGEVRREVSGRFRHILVDEYQDTNPLQADIVRLAAEGHNNVMVVGDDSQSIYSFRGADFRNIMDFPQIFPGTTLIRLEENYRSTQAILSLTNAIIDHATEKYNKKLFSSIAGGDKPIVNGTWDDSAQARWVCDRISGLVDAGVPLSEMAVLFRSGFHSYKLELELTNRQIIFEKRGGMKLTESAHIKDILSYLRVINNPADHLSWNRILLLLDKVGPKTVQRVLETIRSAEDPLAALHEYPAPPAWRAQLKALLTMLKDISAPGFTPVMMYDAAMDYYREIFERIYHDDYPTRSRDLEQLRQLVAGYPDLQSFMDDTTLDPPGATDETAGGRLGGDGESLVLSTIHSAKGLEWDHVFVIHLAAGRFPTCQPFMRDEWEEERRMFYVAATRARKNLYLTYLRESNSFDRQAASGGISPFLAEIPSHLVQGGESMTGWSGAAVSAAVVTRSRQPRDISMFQEGVAVRHPFFGEGRIEKSAGTRSVEVFFSRHGRKTLHLDYARLEVIE